MPPEFSENFNGLVALLVAPLVALIISVIVHKIAMIATNELAITIILFWVFVNFFFNFSLLFFLLMVLFPSVIVDVLESSCNNSLLHFFSFNGSFFSLNGSFSSLNGITDSPIFPLSPL